LFSEVTDKSQEPVSTNNVSNVFFDDDGIEVTVPTSLEEMKRDYDVKNKRRDLISGKIGEKLLQGFTEI